jgi:hypothetical protein
MVAQAASPTEYEVNRSVNANDIFYGSYWRAQTFTPSQTHTVTSVQLPLLKVGNPTGDVIVSIRATNSLGQPTGGDLATGKIATSSIVASWSPARWYTFDLGAGYQLEQGKMYAIVWRAPNATASTPMYYWVNLSGSYSKGRVMAGTNGASWMNLSVWDGAFVESGTTVAPVIIPDPDPEPQPEPEPEQPAGTVQEYEVNRSVNANDIFYGSYWRAQTFTPSQTHTVTSVQLPLLKVGNPTGDVIVSIRATNSLGQPTGGDLATGKIATSSIVASWSPARWYTFDLGAGYQLEQGKMYAIVWRAPNATASTPMYYWVNLSGSYSKGRVMAGTNGASWMNLSVWDGAFVESGTTVAPVIIPDPDPAVNQAPVLSPIGNKSVTVGQSLSFILNATDPDGDTLNYTASGLPSGAIFNNRTFSWTPTTAGTYKVTFTVSDGKLTDSETVSITVLAKTSSTSNFKNVGYISIYFLDSAINTIPWEQFDYVIWQNVWVNSNSDPTLKVQDGYPWRQITDFSNACHAHNVKALGCIYGTSDLVSIISNSSTRARLVTNLTNMVNTYNLDGINIDWEASGHPDLYSTFIQELRASLGPNKVISAIGTFLGPPLNIASSAEPYLDFVTVMTYDYWHIPSYGTLADVSGTMKMWENAGFPKEKLVMGIPFHATTAAGTTGWTAYSTIVNTYNPAPSQNTAGPYYFNGVDLVKEKTAWVKNNGYGGVFNYELGIDKLNHPASLTNAIWAAINNS